MNQEQIEFLEALLETASNAEQCFTPGQVPRALEDLAEGLQHCLDHEKKEEPYDY